MQTVKQQYKAIISLYRQQTGEDSVDMHEVAAFAIKNGVKPPTPKTPVALLAEKLSSAAREEVERDEVTGYPYRVNFAVTTWSGDNQLTLWHKLDTATRPTAHKGLMQRRNQMVGDAVSLDNDAMRWNRIHPNDDPIQIPFDFAFDITLARHTPPDEEKLAA